MKKNELFDLIEKNHYIGRTPHYKLYSCSAEYFDIEVNGQVFTVLQSYSSYVAMYSHRTGTVYVRRYYSATTYQHIYKFARKMEAMRITWLYQKSDNIIETAISKFANTIKLTSEQWERLEQTGYSCYIENV